MSEILVAINKVVGQVKTRAILATPADKQMGALKGEL